MLDNVEEAGAGALPAVFPVSDLASASIAAAALALAEFIGARHGRVPHVRVDRRLASFWFDKLLRPIGWELPPIWDAIAGDYPAADGWIRLHTNAPAHRAAALRVLGIAAERATVAAAVSQWRADELEAAIVEAGGCAGAMRDLAAWAAHAQGRAVAAEPLIDVAPAGPGERAAWPVDASRPLHGIRLLDLTRVLAGPVATRFLAGFGVQVLRIDPPDWDEPAIVPEMTLGKRCTRLDLREGDARAAFETLLREADLLVHGYRPDALARLGYDAQRIRALRPGLVEVCHDAYGWTGPWQGRRGFDSLVQMSAGIAAEGMRRRGADRPVPLPVQAHDHATGYMAAAAALRGLTRRLTSGEATRSRASLARTAHFLAGFAARDDEPAFADESADDVAPPIEQTAWGPAQRLRSPVEIEGCAMRWDSPACALGSSDARWWIGAGSPA